MNQAISDAVRRETAREVLKARTRLVDQWLLNHFAPERLTSSGVQGAVDSEADQRLFLGSLIDLFAASTAERSDGVRSVYLDERLRFAPHHADPATLRRYLMEVATLDEAALVSLLPAANRNAASSLWSEVHAPLFTTPPGEPVRLLAIGDCLLNEVRVFLPDVLRRAEIPLDMRCLYFSASEGRALSSDQALRFVDDMAPHAIAFSFLTYAGLPPFTSLMREADTLDASTIRDRVVGLMKVIRSFLAEIRERTDAVFLVHNVSGLPLGRWRRLLPLPALSKGQQAVVNEMNTAIAEYCRDATNTLHVDEHAVAVSRGYRECSRPVVPRSVAAKGYFHTSQFGAYLADEYGDAVRSLHVLRKAKVLLIDFDNTLWDGVMADGEVRQFAERQQLLRSLKESGMLLVSVSKNSQENIRWSEMVLKPEDFALHKISWDQKAKSIAAAAQELDLGLDSFVLIDDNPTELELVRRELPTVKLLNATDEFTWRSLQRLLDFPNTQATAEARSRTEMYRAQAERREAQAASVDYPSMMRSLGLQAKVGRALSKDLDRVAELIQRTNQFNTTTIRYTKAEIKTLLASTDSEVYVAELSDKLGSHGLVAVAIVRAQEQERQLDSFVMSCRAMGFGLERLLMHVVVARQPNDATVSGKFIPTDRNSPASGLFRDAGFRELDAGRWELAQGTVPAAPDWIQLIDR